MKIFLSRIVAGLISFGIGFFFLSGGWQIYQEYVRMQNYSAHAIGHITKKRFQTAADGSGIYYLDYWFVSSGGHKIEASSGISKQQWDALQVSDNLDIRYDPSNPGRNIPLYGGSPSLMLAFFMLVLGVVFLIFGAFRFPASFKKRSQ